MQVLTADDDTPTLERVRGAMEQALDAGPAIAVLPRAPKPWRDTLLRAVHPERPVERGLVVPTSGSTGRPVGVVLGAGAVRWSAEAVNERLGGAGSWVLALPLTHVAGLMVLARALVGGRGVVAVGEDWSQALDELPDRPRYTSLVPTQVRRLLDEQPTALAAFDAVLVGGSGLDEPLRARAEGVGVRLVESYGMTETCGGCLHDGSPLPGVDVRLDESGLVRLAGPMLASAYRRTDADEPVAPDGWFATSDIGRWHQGRLRLVGRLDDVVTTGGVSVSLSAVDALLAEHPELADAAAVGVPDAQWGTAIVAVAVPAPGHEPTPTSVRAFVADRAEPAYVPRRVVLVADLDRPAPGKVNRQQLARDVEGRR